MDEQLNNQDGNIQAVINNCLTTEAAEEEF